MSTAEQLAPLEPVATATAPLGSPLTGPIADGMALVSAALTLLVLSGITPIEPVHALATALNFLNALIHGNVAPAVTAAELIQAAIVALLLIGNIVTDTVAHGPDADVFTADRGHRARACAVMGHRHVLGARRSDLDRARR